MNTLKIIVLRMFAALFLLAAGFAIGYPTGQRNGFTTGTEWALVQADILAKEAGMDMPVFIENDELKVVLRQPRNLYRTAWKMADRYDISTHNAKRDSREDAAEAGDDTEDQTGSETQSADVVIAACPDAPATAASGRSLPVDQAGVRTF